MHVSRIVSGLFCVAVLSACASTGTAPTPVNKPALGTALNDADNALKAGQNDKALLILQEAARDYPSEKMPWLRMAQMRFETNNYGQAIVDAEEVLERDSDDTLAHSIIAVSGLRVASKALTDLTQKNNLTGNIKSEAQDLTKLLRSALGEDTLVPARARGASVPIRKIAPTVTPAPAPAKTAPSNDPFGNLK